MKKNLLKIAVVVPLFFASYVVNADTVATMEIETATTVCKPRILTIGQPLQVRLTVNLSVGQSWTVVDIPTNILKLANTKFEPLNPNLLGSPGTNIIDFDTINKGKGILTLSYRSGPNADPQIYHCDITVE